MYREELEEEIFRTKINITNTLMKLRRMIVHSDFDIEAELVKLDFRKKGIVTYSQFSKLCKEHFTDITPIELNAINNFFVF